MKGALIVNSFFQSKSFEAVQKRLISAFEKSGIALEICGNADLLPVLGTQERQPWDFALFWNKDTALASALENRGLRLFNRAEAIRLCDDKGLTHLVLEQAGIPQPKTILAPQTYENVGYTQRLYLHEVARKLGLPMVVKERFGSFGQQVYLVRDEAELMAQCDKLGVIKHLYQEYVPSLYENRASDLRICVVGGRVIAAIRRESQTGDFRANLEEGGKATSVCADATAQSLALRAVEALRLDFAGVDLLCDPVRGYLICEVNSNFFFGGLANATGIDPAEAICALVRSELQKA